MKRPFYRMRFSQNFLGGGRVSNHTKACANIADDILNLTLFLVSLLNMLAV